MIPFLKCANLNKSFPLKLSSRSAFVNLFCRIIPFVFSKSFANRTERILVLDGITFELNRGDSLGIVGANGAGKSTLLQILTGTLQPNSGTVLAKGKICSLLELGSGFNPEFSGIENVKLSCALMNPSEKSTNIIDEILNFSEIGSFADQPLKYYSTGMAMRLAFSVIVFSKPDILIIDEALAVGDISFSEKCITYLKNFRRNGILIVSSHDLSQLKVLCDLCIWLDSGKVMEFAKTKQVTESYHSFMIDNLNNNINKNLQKLVKKSNEAIHKSSKLTRTEVELMHVKLVDTKTENLVETISENKSFDCKLEISLIFNELISKPILGFYVRNNLGLNLFGANTVLNSDLSKEIQIGQKFRISFHFKMPILEQGQHTITIALSDGTQEHHRVVFWVHNAFQFSSFCKTPTGLVGVEMKEVSIDQIKS